MNHPPKPLTSHLLIGPAASGKTTLAQTLAAIGNYHIVSTDQIRAEFFGEEIIQGDWRLIEKEALNRIEKSLAAGQPVIYDATNTKRPWRMDLLAKIRQISPQNSQWMAWYLQTPLEICLERNAGRSRQVPPEVIEKMFLPLEKFPPLPAEGFVDVVTLKNGEYYPPEIKEKIDNLHRTITNRKNRTSKNFSHHPYSQLLDCDRLLHLISILSHNPGLSPTEITDIIGKTRGAIYADKKAIYSDLKFLENNYIISQNYLSQLPEKLPPINLPKTEHPNIINHPYSGAEQFQRLLTTIRIILNHPFLPDNNKNHLTGLAEAVNAELQTEDKKQAKLRKDIENILKPYNLIPQIPLKKGYFAGTAILERRELLQVLDILQAQAKSIEDPIALDVYKKFEIRMLGSKIIEEAAYPVRAIAHQSMVDIDLVEDPTALCHKTKEIEKIILKRELIELGKRRNTGRFNGDKEGPLKAWLLQILFHDRAWYLALEYQGGKPEENGLIKIERLDRLYLSRRHLGQRSLEEQKASLKKMEKLLNNSIGIHLGTNSLEQKQFLSPKTRERQKVEITIKLRFNDNMFKFISEGTKRFPKNRMKMSPPNGKTLSTTGLFCLEKSPDSRFPNRLEATLPKWCLESVDLWKWIVSFGGQVIVEEPPELVEKVRSIGEGIVGVYD